MKLIVVQPAARELTAERTNTVPDLYVYKK